MRIKLFTILIIPVLLSSNPSTDFSLKNIENHVQSFLDLKGKKGTVIDFWATYCQPCLQSLPELKKLHEEFESEGIAFVGINVDGSRNLSKVKPFIRSFQINYPVLLDINFEVMEQMNVTVIPTLIIMDSNDKIVFRYEGYKPGDEAMIRSQIQKFLENEND